MKRTYRPHIPKDKAYIRKVERFLPRQKQQEHIPFENLNAVFSLLGITQSPFYYKDFEGFDSALTDTLGTEAFRRIKKAEKYPALKKALTKLWDYLAEEDKPRKSDIIFVFGGSSIPRATTGIKLYQKGLGRKVIFTGSHPSYRKTPHGNVTEADQFAELACESGIPKEDILVENKSINTPENVVFGMRVLSKMNIQPKSIIMVSTPYHLRRCFMTLRANVLPRTKIYRVVAPIAYRRENFYKTEKGWLYVYSEYIKLWGARLMKHF